MVESDTRNIKCDLGICPEHPHTLERLAILETALKDIKTVNESVIARLDKIRDATMEELKILRMDIQKGILERYPKEVVVCISILTGLSGTLLAALVTLIVSHYLE